MKPDPGHTHAFLFSEGQSCGPWLKVPTEAVESVEFLRTVRCKDHDHPFVGLGLKEPPEDNPLATFFAALARRTARIDVGTSGYRTVDVDYAPYYKAFVAGQDQCQTACALLAAQLVGSGHSITGCAFDPVV